MLVPGHPLNGRLLAYVPDSCGSADPVCNLASPSHPHTPPWTTHRLTFLSLLSVVSFPALDLEFELEIIYFLPASPWGVGS